MRVAGRLTTPKTPTTDNLFGRRVEDDYRWLETPTRARESWIHDQMERTDGALESLPDHGAIKARLQQLVTTVIGADQGERIPSEGIQVQWSREPGARYKLTRFDQESPAGVVVFDPNAWPTGETLGWNSLSPNGRYLAYAKVINGQDHGVLEIMDVASGKVKHRLRGANTLNPSVWAGQGDRLITSLPGYGDGLWSFDVSADRLDSRPLTPERLAVYGEVAEHNGYVLFTRDSRSHLQEEAVLVTPTGGRVSTDIPRGKMSFSAQGPQVYIQTTAGADDGRILRVDLDKVGEGSLQSHPVVPEKPGRRLLGFQALADGVAVSFMDQSMPGLAVYDAQGRLRHEIKSEQPGMFGELKTDAQGDLLYQWSTLTQPRVTRKLDLQTLETELVSQDQLPGFNPSDYTTERRWFTSEDGTRVPMTIAYRKDLKLDGGNPTHLHVYGGFATAQEADFKSTRVPFLEAGGICAIVHARGGNEMGEEWHDQATGLNRSKVHQDVEAAARFLTNEGYTSAQHLGLEGTSNGALVTGVAVTQHPELYDAAVAHVGLFDMARFERLGGGGWSPEYGTMRRPDQALGLLSWSPYHNVEEGVSYPAMLVSTGKHDNRVNPAHSYKFAARMQEVETPDRPVLLRVEENLGHGHGLTLDQFLDRQADSWAFLLSELTDSDSTQGAGSVHLEE